MGCTVGCDVTGSEEAADEALLGRLRAAIGGEHAVDMSEDDQLDAVLRMLLDHPGAAPRLQGPSGHRPRMPPGGGAGEWRTL